MEAVPEEGETLLAAVVVEDPRRSIGPSSTADAAHRLLRADPHKWIVPVSTDVVETAAAPQSSDQPAETLVVGDQFAAVCVFVVSAVAGDKAAKECRVLVSAPGSDDHSTGGTRATDKGVFTWRERGARFLDVPVGGQLRVLLQDARSNEAVGKAQVEVAPLVDGRPRDSVVQLMGVEGAVVRLITVAVPRGELAGHPMFVGGSRGSGGKSGASSGSVCSDDASSEGGVGGAGAARSGVGVLPVVEADVVEAKLSSREDPYVELEMRGAAVQTPTVKATQHARWDMAVFSWTRVAPEELLTVRLFDAGPHRGWRRVFVS